MPKLIGMFRRKEGITHTEFREYYETRHAPLALSLYGDLFAAYRRNYVEHDDHHLDPARAQADDLDVITEIVFDTAEAMNEMFARTSRDPKVREAIATDEARFMDRPASRILIITDHCQSPIS